VEGAEEPASMTSAAGIIVLGTKRILIGGGGTGAPRVAEACRSVVAPYAAVPPPAALAWLPPLAAAATGAPRTPHTTRAVNGRLKGKLKRERKKKARIFHN